MFAVIFRAKIKNFDAEYFRTAEMLRDKALSQYGCREFISFEDNGEEVAISWWDSKDQIVSWKNDKDHLAAQTLGRERWYDSVNIQILEVVREYN